MPIVADRTSAVIGVDTHTDTHTAAVLTATGAVLAQTTVTTDPAGISRLLAWAADHAPNGWWAVEGTRSHGHGLLRTLTAAGHTVLQAPPPTAATRRRAGKSDTLDAVAAAQIVLATTLDKVTVPRADGDREALRILLTCRRHHTQHRTATVNLLKALILTADDTLRDQLRRLPTRAQVRTLLTLPTPTTTDTQTRIRHQQLHTLATTITATDKLLTANHRELHTLVSQTCPALLDQPGVGPVTAATLLTTWSHHGRVRSEAAFAALCGASPIPASSGRTNRVRLNRGGDRTANAALHTIALTRRRIHQPTRDYVTKRTTEGRTPRDINRCLKRYLARQLYRIMQTHTA
ncbi:IS110 family transposase [Catellatospora methionotrophica]|uniref:IS110 family transposase n=1 Tax=Catellatospora methionotrophica TaxID=121620 RepID=UPI0033EE10A7